MIWNLASLFGVGVNQFLNHSGASMAALCHFLQKLGSGVHAAGSELVRRRDAGCSRGAAVDIEKSAAVFLVGVCVVHIHQRYPDALQCRAHVLNTLYWLAIVW